MMLDSQLSLLFIVLSIFILGIGVHFICSMFLFRTTSFLKNCRQFSKCFSYQVISVLTFQNSLNSPKHLFKFFVEKWWSKVLFRFPSCSLELSSYSDECQELQKKPQRSYKSFFVFASLRTLSEVLYRNFGGPKINYPLKRLFVASLLPTNNSFNFATSQLLWMPKTWGESAFALQNLWIWNFEEEEKFATQSSIRLSSLFVLLFSSCSLDQKRRQRSV